MKIKNTRIHSSRMRTTCSSVCGGSFFNWPSGISGLLLLTFWQINLQIYKYARSPVADPHLGADPPSLNFVAGGKYEQTNWCLHANQDVNHLKKHQSFTIATRGIRRM